MKNETYENLRDPIKNNQMQELWQLLPADQEGKNDGITAEMPVLQEVGGEMTILTDFITNESNRPATKLVYQSFHCSRCGVIVSANAEQCENCGVRLIGFKNNGVINE